VPKKPCPRRRGKRVFGSPDRKGGRDHFTFPGRRRRKDGGPDVKGGTGLRSIAKPQKSRPDADAGSCAGSRISATKKSLRGPRERSGAGRPDTGFWDPRFAPVPSEKRANPIKPTDVQQLHRMFAFQAVRQTDSAGGLWVPGAFALCSLWGPGTTRDFFRRPSAHRSKARHAPRGI